MTAQLLEGKILAQKIQVELLAEIEQFVSKYKRPPCLVGLQATQDPSSEWYMSQQERLAAKLRVNYQRIPFHQISTQTALENKIRDCSMTDDCDGVFIAMPLPQGWNADQALFHLNPQKDVEGIHPANLGMIVLRKSKIIPPTAFAAFKLIEASGISLRGKRAAIVGQSAIVGRPLQLLLGENRVTTTVCNSGTSELDMKAIVESSDIVVGCAGQPGLIKGSWIRSGAVVIDVGTTEVNGALVGDVEFEAAKERAGFITPVPGGVGPLTVTMLMRNLMNAAQWQEKYLVR